MKLLLLNLAVVIILFDSLVVAGKGGGGSGNHGQSKGNSHANEKSHSSGSKNENVHENKASQHGHKGYPPPSSSSDAHKDEKNSKKDKGSSKSSLAGGLIGGGLLGYAAGRSHHDHKNCERNFLVLLLFVITILSLPMHFSTASECDHKKRPNSVDDISCCPSMPLALVANFTCECEEKDSLNFCKLFCVLDHNGWLGENNTIDSTLTSDSIVGKVDSKKVWIDIIPALVELCIERGEFEK
jgi:hypothetical protein